MALGFGSGGARESGSGGGTQRGGLGTQRVNGGLGRDDVVRGERRGARAREREIL
jgi:hypothetical protein